MLWPFSPEFRLSSVWGFKNEHVYLLLPCCTIMAFTVPRTKAWSPLHLVTFLGIWRDTPSSKWYCLKLCPSSEVSWQLKQLVWVLYIEKRDKTVARRNKKRAFLSLFLDFLVSWWLTARNVDLIEKINYGFNSKRFQNTSLHFGPIT